MSKIIVEYMPLISAKAQKLIKSHVTPSMIAGDESTSQYDIDMVKECLEEYNLTADLQMIRSLKVHYIEI